MIAVEQVMVELSKANLFNGAVWKHNKRGTYYVVEGVALDSETAKIRSVIYKSLDPLDTPQLWHREESEFLSVDRFTYLGYGKPKIEEIQMMLLNEAGWQSIDSVPKDGTKVHLAWRDNGYIAESFAPMSWSDTTGNPLVQGGKGIWVMVNGQKEVMFTWSAEGKGGPEIWKPWKFGDES